MSKIKQQLYLLCCQYVATRETGIKKLIADAQEAANEETKSSAGDKFETGREILQQEIDLNLTRLSELNKMRQTIESIVPDQSNQLVSPGAVVRTNQGSYYVCISAGQIKADDKVHYAISIESPIGAKMKGLSAGETFTLNGKNFLIESVS